MDSCRFMVPPSRPLDQTHQPNEMAPIRIGANRDRNTGILEFSINFGFHCFIYYLPYLIYAESLRVFLLSHKVCHITSVIHFISVLFFVVIFIAFIRLKYNADLNTIKRTK